VETNGCNQVESAETGRFSSTCSTGPRGERAGVNLNTAEVVTRAFGLQPLRWAAPCGAPIIVTMRREEAIAALRGHLPTIRRDFGVRRIALFGSTARGEAEEDSDLDILVEFERDPTFLAFMGLKAFLEDHLGRKIDLVTPDALKPRMRPIVEREAVDVAQG
jgi:predicted nucleotidyltransferase